MPSQTSQRYVQGIRFRGRTSGAVKTLRGFKKGQHKLPEGITPATTAFLARLCEEELGEAAEQVFQQARALCDYKRKDISLSVTSPSAVLSAKDFTLEIAYGFEGSDASSYETVWTLDQAKDLDFLLGDACTELFAGRFQELSFVLTRGATVESVIDAVEALEASELRVDYPSDYAHCLLSVPEVDAQVRFDGSELAMVFSSTAAPSEHLRAFAALREAFALTKSRTLAGLFG